MAVGEVIPPPQTIPLPNRPRDCTKRGHVLKGLRLVSRCFLDAVEPSLQIDTLFHALPVTLGWQLLTALESVLMDSLDRALQLAYTEEDISLQDIYLMHTIQILF